MKDLIAAVEKHSQLILDAERYIWKNPETGYKEYKTSDYMAESFRKLGYELNVVNSSTPPCIELNTLFGMGGGPSAAT